MTSEITFGVGYREPDPSKVENRAGTVARMIVDRVSRTPDREAFRFPVPDEGAGAASGEHWESVTWGQAGERIRRIATGLLGLGIQPEERVAIAATTSYEWILADCAVMCAGAATTTIYPTTTPAEVAYILADSGSRVVFVEDDTQLAKVLAQHAELPALVAIVTFRGKSDERAPVPVYALADLERKGDEHIAVHPDALEAAMDRITPESLATLIYTSGTTGRPKGVRLVHECWTYEGACIDAVNLLTPEHLQYLWLPLSHSFGKVLLSAQLQIGFCSAVDGRVDRIIDNLAIVEPVWMCSAPRVFEKAYSKIVTTIQQEGGVKAKLFDWAFEIGAQVSKLRQAGKEPRGLLAARYKVADTLVLSKIRARFGRNLRFMVSGSAALNREIAEWFHAAGMLILEGYGLTETSAATAVNLPGRWRLGTVGYPFPGTDLTVAEDDELLVRGPGVMRGYHNLPELTSEVLTGDGWFRTGDLAEISDDGFVRITDRKKDLFKTSNGKYVAPALIESMFKTICPYVSQIVVHGEGRTFVSALVTLDPEAVQSYAEHLGHGGMSYAEIVSSDLARKLVQESIDELNAKLNRWETIKKFVILDQDLTVEEGDLTPSLKVKRRAVERRHADLLDTLYV